ncbi:MAG: sigma-54-dependent Fis family transcriptional regulator [Calditrichaeota bacterium]|nr:MAG: sigma-54-dependent Fis family transcriptional regulator [Calditrichota bacterium]
MEKNKILIIDDDKLITWSLSRDLASIGYAIETTADGKSGIKKFSNYAPDLVLLDLKLPDMSGLDVLKALRAESEETIIIMMTAYATVQTAVEAVKLGAADFIKKPFTCEELKIIIDKAIETQELSNKVAIINKELKSKFGINQIIGESPQMQEVIQLIDKIAKSDAETILLTGESGTGKDLVAKAIHYESPRMNYPFMAVNCGALPDTLLESELFGHERGAFTDAKDVKRGLFELADKGSILLDEIGDASPSFQIKLLRFIEEKLFKRVGGTKDIEVNVRIIAATNKDLKKLVKEEQFREELFYRLNVIPIALPPLCKREKDIELLVKFFIEHFNKKFKKKLHDISNEAMVKLTNYSWPGNIRELRNVIERIIILETGDTISVDHLPSELTSNDDNSRLISDFYFSSTDMPLDEIERALILKALANTNENQSHAAKLLNISRHALRYKMKKYNILN